MTSYRARRVAVERATRRAAIRGEVRSALADLAAAEYRKGRGTAGQAVRAWLVAFTSAIVRPLLVEAPSTGPRWSRRPPRTRVRRAQLAAYVSGFGPCWPDARAGIGSVAMPP